MFYSVKKIATNIALLCLILGSLSAASIVDSPPSVADFPNCPTAASAGDFLAKKAEIEVWFGRVDPDGALFKSVFPGGLPANKVAYNAQNPKITYTSWYNSKFAVSAASSAKIAEVEKAAEQYRREAEGAKNEAKVAKEQVQAVQQQLTTTTSDLQGKLVAQATAGDLVARNSRMLVVQEQYRHGLVTFQDLVPVIDADKWVLKIPYTKNTDRVHRFINIPFDSEAELDRVMTMPAQDAVRECALRNNDLVYLVKEATDGKLGFGLDHIAKVRGYYAFALPIEYTDGRQNKADAIMFSYDNLHDAEEGFRKAQFFMNIGAGKGVRSAQYKQVLTPRPARPTDEPQAVTALMDAYYLLLDGASKNQETKDTVNAFKKVFDEAYIAIESLCQVTRDANTLDAILLNVDKLEALAAAYASPGKTIESLKTNIRNSIKKAKWYTEIPGLISDFFENFMLAWAQAQNLSSHDLFLKCIEDFCQCINSIKKTGIVNPLSFNVYKNALVEDEKKVKELIREEEQKIYDEAVLNFDATKREFNEKINRLGVDWSVAQISEDDIRRHNNKLASGDTSPLGSVPIVDNGQYKKIPSLLHFLRNDPVFLLIALQNSTVLDFLTTRPNSVMLKPEEKNIFALFENELDFLTLPEKQAFFVYLKNIITDFSSLDLLYYNITTNKNRVTVSQIEALLSIVKKSFSLPTKSNYKYTDDSKRIKAFVKLVHKFASDELATESVQEALNQTLPFLTEKLAGKTVEVVDDIIEIAEIPERDIGTDKATLANCMGYVAERLDVARIIATKPRHEILAEIEVLREAKKVVETERFSSNSLVPPANFGRMKAENAARATRTPTKSSPRKAPAPGEVAAVAAPKGLAPTASPSVAVAGGAGGSVVKKAATPIKTSGETPDQLKTRLLGEINAIKANLATRDLTVDPFKTNSEDIVDIEAAISKINPPELQHMTALAMKERTIKRIQTALGN